MPWPNGSGHGWRYKTLNYSGRDVSLLLRLKKAIREAEEIFNWRFAQEGSHEGLVWKWNGPTKSFFYKDKLLEDCAVPDRLLGFSLVLGLWRILEEAVNTSNTLEKEEFENVLNLWKDFKNFAQRPNCV